MARVEPSGTLRAVRVTLCDVGPRDGLQNEPETLAPDVRADLVRRLAAAGLPRIEAVSFVATSACRRWRAQRRSSPASARSMPSSPGSS